MNLCIIYRDKIRMGKFQIIYESPWVYIDFGAYGYVLMMRRYDIDYLSDIADDKIRFEQRGNPAI